MFEPRVYRAAFVPALLALVLTMFSLQSRPSPLPQGLAADVLFDGQVAASPCGSGDGRLWSENIVNTSASSAGTNAAL